MTDIADLIPGRPRRKRAPRVELLDAVVTSVDPVEVRIGTAEESVELESANAAVTVGERGLVARQGTRLVWIGGGTSPARIEGEIGALVSDVEAAQDAADNAAIAAGAAATVAAGSSAVMTGTSATPPTTRRNGSPLQAGDLYYRLDTNVPPRLIDIRVRSASAWVQHQIAAGSVLVPSSIGAVLIADGAVTAPKLHVDALNFKTATGLTLTAGTVTGTTVRTAETGERIQMDAVSNSLRSFDAAGAARTRLANGVLGFLMSDGSTSGELMDNGGQLRITAPGVDPTSGVRVEGRTIEVAAGAGGVAVAAGSMGLSLTSTGPAALYGSTASLASTSGTVTVQASGGAVTVAGSAGVVLNAAASGAALGYWAVTPVDLGGGDWRSGLRFYGLGGSGTTGGADMPQSALAANLYIHSNGLIYRTSSAARYKLDIRDVDVDPWALLDVRPRDWVDRTQRDMDSDYDVRTPGLIAEEVDAAGLGLYVTRESDGTIQGVMYDRLWTLLIPLVRDLRARLDLLEARHG